MKTIELMKRYPYIYIWGQRMGSYSYYIENQMEEALADNAPRTAIYKRSDGWHTADDFKGDVGTELHAGAKALLERLAKAD